jgi:glycosyltransferase involved in cell wall biosynthesis
VSTGAGVIGVVIRTLNESEFIERCLETLGRQSGDFKLDIRVVDSGSTDGTVELAKAAGVRIVNLLPDEFDYSKALNVGIEAVEGDLVVIISAHAIPASVEWLERITTPFVDARVAGVCSREVPWPDAPWGEVHRLGHQFGDDRREYPRDTEKIFFSNAASVVRRSVWRDYPFTLPASEDLDWAKRVVAAGWTIVYEPRAAVYHSHRENPREQALRMIDISRALMPSDAVPTRLRGTREALGMLVRDSRKIFTLEESLSRKRHYLAELLRMVAYYVIDFSRSGTTAERRQHESRRRRRKARDSRSKSSGRTPSS